MIVLRDIRRVDSVVLAFGLVVIQHVVEQELDLAIGNVTRGEADAPKLRDLAQAVWVEGYVSTSSSYTDLANSAYTLTLTHMEVYDY